MGSAVYFLRATWRPGQFGAGTKSYFSLLRFLLLLNVLASVLTACMILLPTWLEGAPPGPPAPNASSPCGSYSPGSQGLVAFSTELFNLLSGEGFLEWSPLFYGFYPPRSHLAITYLCCTFAVCLLYLLLTLHRSVSGLKQTLLAESGAVTSYSHRVFSAWDFGLSGKVHVRLRQRNILFELQVELEEAAVRRQAAVRTLGQQARVWSVRVLLNMAVVALLGAALYGVYWATGATAKLQEMRHIQGTPLLKLVVEYLPSIFISGVNFVLPPVFKLIAPLEGYTRSRQIITLFSTCSPASRNFRASTVNFFFPLVLLLGLASSTVPVLYSIFLIPPSKLCGPFRGQSSIWAEIPESICKLPQTAQEFLFFLGTQAFAVPLLLISSILMVYTVALANSYGRLISELKRQIETEAQNKVFLAQRAVALSSANRAL
ncbi:Transmembrane channel-like protein 4, partial [Eschrichtius robustus]|nr:Transmembrane channel-like protein 4 [Eschrichtius robustus]